MATNSPAVASSSSQPGTSNVAATSLVIRESSRHVIPPVLEPNTVTPGQTATPTIVHQPLSLVDPTILGSATVPTKTAAPVIAHQLVPLVNPPFLESAQAVPDQTISSPVVLDSVPLAAPVLGASQTITPNAIRPITNQNESLDGPPSLPEPSHMVAPNEVFPQRPVPLHPIQKPRPATVQHSSDLTGGETRNGSGGTMTTKGTYKPQHNVRLTTASQAQRNSIDGAPDIILLLGPSGYEVIDPPVTSTGSDTDVSTTPSSRSPLSTSTLEDFVVPSSQPQEELLVIPAETETVVPTTLSSDGLTVHSEDPLPVPAVSKASTPGRFHLALRAIPTYSLD